MVKLILSAMAVLMFLLSGCGQSDLTGSEQNKPVQPVPKQTVQVEQKAVAPTSIYATVVHVADGDTITVKTKNGEKLKVRFYGIDAPEKAQPYGPQSTGILKKLILNKNVNIVVNNTDRYGRKVAWVYLDKQDINAEMIRLGAAWHYKYYDKSSKYQQYDDLESYARKNRKGLWNKNNPTPPWDYRKAEREKGKN